MLRNIPTIALATLLIAAGSLVSARTAAAQASIEIVIYGSGTTLPASSVAACSEPDCLGYSVPESEWTWSVSYPKNYVGWGMSGGNSKKRVYLLVDGKAVTSVRSGLLVLSTSGLRGPHVVQGMGYGADGSVALSTPVTICFNTNAPC